MSKKNPTTADLKAGLYLTKNDSIAVIWIKRRINLGQYNLKTGVYTPGFLYDMEILNSKGEMQVGQKVLIRKAAEKSFIRIGSV